MLGNYFYHEIIRKTVIAFGTLFNDDDTTDKYNEGDIFESEADLLIDFSESNPFGSF